jgi:hypothetical protein
MAVGQRAVQVSGGGESDLHVAHNRDRVGVSVQMRSAGVAEVVRLNGWLPSIA